MCFSQNVKPTWLHHTNKALRFAMTAHRQASDTHTRGVVIVWGLLRANVAILSICSLFIQEPEQATRLQSVMDIKVWKRHKSTCKNQRLPEDEHETEQKRYKQCYTTASDTVCIGAKAIFVPHTNTLNTRCKCRPGGEFCRHPSPLSIGRERKWMVRSLRETTRPAERPMPPTDFKYIVIRLFFSYE